MCEYLYCTIVCASGIFDECLFFFFFQAEDGIRDYKVTGVQTCALPIWHGAALPTYAPRRMFVFPVTTKLLIACFDACKSKVCMPISSPGLFHSIYVALQDRKSVV